ncbi:MAG: hypothetical protein K9M75_10245 [Phycisphaerae bacterium]|nr:hypothetical protein [Phycisphaerae bacterium]
MTKKLIIMAIVGLAAAAVNAAVVGQLGVLDVSGVNPATGKVWAAGDQYRLVFVTSATTDATSTDITTYNAFVQGLAEAAGLGGGVWNVIGSTATVDARDNTGTNRYNASHVSVPIFLIDGVTKIADNNADLWDGGIDAFIDMTETGTGGITGWVWTGTDPDGTDTSSVGQMLGGTPNVQVGKVEKTSGYWVRHFNTSATEGYPVYALSEPLTVQANFPSVDAGHSWITWSGEPVILDPVVVNNDTQVPQRELTIVWIAEPADGVLITEDGSAADDTTTPEAVVTITKAGDTDEAVVVTLMLSVTLEGVGTVNDTITIDVYDNSCEAVEAMGVEAAYSASDFNKDCVVDINDLAVMAAAWLEDYSL